MPPAAEEAIRAVSALATQLGNKISVHMLDFLSTTNDLPSGFRELSSTFLDTCRTLWAIEAGVTELSNANRALPELVVNEIEKKFVTAYADFQHLDKCVLKLVQYEHRGTWGKLQRGFHRPGQELGRIHESLKKTNEALQISGMAFQWSLGETRPEEFVGIGYASLAAALDRIAKGRSAMAVNKMDPGALDRSSQSQSQSHIHSSSSIHSSPSVPPKDSPQRNTPVVEPPESLSQVDPVSLADDMSSILSLNGFLSARHGRESVPERMVSPDPPTMLGLKTTSVGDVYARHSGPNAIAKPRMESMHNRLSYAITGRNHGLLEQLLGDGVSPDTQDDFHPLIEAVNQRDMDSMRILLQYRADPNAPDGVGKTPLLVAVEQSFEDEALMLLRFGADANYHSTKYDSPLLIAITNKNTALTQSLLANGGNPNQETRNETTLLIEAIRSRTPLHLVTLLLSSGCDTNRKDNTGATALCSAVQSNQPETVSTLLDHGANPNLPGPEHALWSAVYRPDCLHILLARGADIHKTPGLMERATSVNRIDAIRVLLQAGVSPNIKKDGIYTPLCSSIRDDRPEIFSLLLRHGADPNLPASEYPSWKCITHNRLHFLPDLLAAGADLKNPPGIAECAVKENNLAALEWLVQQKDRVNINDRNASGATALTTAIRENRPDLVQYLLSHGADPNLRGQDWPIYMATNNPSILSLILPSVADISAHKGVVERAVQANQLESVKLLLAAGASSEWKNGGVFSPLTTALRERHVDIVHFLLNEGNADPNAPGEHLPLVKAIRRCEGGDFAMIELLLEKGADPNVCYRGWNAVMQAIENRDLKLLRTLIDRGGPVDFGVKDESGRGVLEMAQGEGWEEGVQVLMERERK
ncbi:ankyrin repeat-containing domain protein [Aspergillus filifer]